MVRKTFLVAVAGMAALAIAAASAQDKSETAANRLVGTAERSGGDTTGAAATRRQNEAQPNPLEYRIGPGDVLGIEVWKEPDASIASAPVRPDGKLSLPMVGEVEATGLTPTGLEVLLTTRYREYIRDTHVTVVVKEINSKKVYLVGEVKKEGPVRIQAPITVLQALAEAGGVTDYAKRRKIYVLRSVDGRQVKLPFDYDAVLRGENTEQNVTLLTGDTVVVPR
ncbi:MAG: polysaccharide biosynthesis/export family protein [Bryobacteraceae bacterium]|jgi:polysaccharide export outer membrane protein